ncbi:MAG: alanine--glyoxylate aminotransferase family protein [Methanobacteriota archaeon]
MTHKRLLIPGPTEVSAEVLQQQTRWMIGHRGSDYTALYTGILDKIKKYFDTKQHATVTTASGTLWMDITGRSIVKKKALAGVCGAFSERMYKTVLDSGKEATPLSVELGKAIKPEMVMDALKKDDYDTLIIVHNETATGVRNPIEDIGKAVKKEYPDIIFVVDSVSSAGGDLLVPEKLNTDVLFTSTQKCFALPPGLSIGIYSEAAVARARTVKSRGHYTDLIAIHDYFVKKQQNPTTPNISLLYALDYQLDRMLLETAHKRYERHLAMAEYTRKWAVEAGFEMFPEPGYESITVSTIKNTKGRNIGDLNKALGKKGYQIANGYGDLKDKTFRIGHMGEWNLDEIKSLLWHIDEIWKE